MQIGVVIIYWGAGVCRLRRSGRDFLRRCGCEDARRVWNRRICALKVTTRHSSLSRPEGRRRSLPRQGVHRACLGQLHRNRSESTSRRGQVRTRVAVKREFIDGIAIAFQPSPHRPLGDADEISTDRCLRCCSGSFRRFCLGAERWQSPHHDSGDKSSFLAVWGIPRLIFRRRAGSPSPCKTQCRWFMLPAAG
jgi:hypothetical protein